MAVAVLVLQQEQREDSMKTWGRVLLMVIFCNIGPQSLIENNIALLRRGSTIINWRL